MTEPMWRDGGQVFLPPGPQRCPQPQAERGGCWLRSHHLEAEAGKCPGSRVSTGRASLQRRPAGRGEPRNISGQGGRSAGGEQRRGESWVGPKHQSLSRAQLCDPKDSRPPLSSVHGILQARSGFPLPSPGDLPNPGIRRGLLHCRQILHQLSHQGSFWLRLREGKALGYQPAHTGPRTTPLVDPAQQGPGWRSRADRTLPGLWVPCTLLFVYRAPALKVLTSWSGRLMGTQAWACRYFDRSEYGFQGLWDQRREGQGHGVGGGEER